MTPENALHRTAALCSRSEQCEADLRLKLTAWGIGCDDADAIIARLKTGNFLCDNRYAHAFVRDKFRFGGWGRIKIAYALRMKHIAADVIDEALCEIAEEDYHSTLLYALRAKLRSVAGREPVHRRAALFRFAASRGFEPDVISQAINEILKNDI